jgi:hypothetical protein
MIIIIYKKYDYYMYKGYRNRLFYKDHTNKSINHTLFPQISKCSKCNKLNQIMVSPFLQNIHMCLYCGQPFYIVKPG